MHTSVSLFLKNKKLLSVICAVFLVPLKASSDGKASIEYDHYLKEPIVTIFVNQEPKKIVLDTGAIDLMLTLNKSILEKHGKKTERTNTIVNSNGDVFQGSFWQLDYITFAGKKFQNMDVFEYIPWDVTLSGVMKREIQIGGVIGTQLFEGKITQIDFKNHYVEFLNEVPQLKDSSAWNSYDKNFSFDVLIDGKTVKAMIDTAASNCVVGEKSPILEMKTAYIEKDQELSLYEPKLYPNFLNPKKSILYPDAAGLKCAVYPLDENFPDIIIGLDSLMNKKIYIDGIQHRFAIID